MTSLEYLKLSKTTILRIQSKIWKWYEVHKRDHLPWRLTNDPYAILVSEIMLQQTQVDRVIPKFIAFLRAFPTPQLLAEASTKEVLILWSGLGYNNRAIRLQKTVAEIIHDYQGNVPNSYDDLLLLPGIGDYAARAILAFAFNQDVAVVDTNIRRILIKECKLDEACSPQELLDIAVQLVPKGKSCEWHSALMDYGALYLTAVSSGIAPLSKQSTFKDSNRYFRGKIVKYLLQKNEASSFEIAQYLQKDIVFTTTILKSLEKDEMIVKRGTKFQLPH
jgi:A/G-specific adenine glycosylase